MCEDGDQEVSELEMETRNWNKLEKDMKSIGYREGAVQGKDLSLQEGFNLGYADGFKLGESIGMIKGLISCQSELGHQLNQNSELSEKAIYTLSNEGCILCSAEKNTSSQSKEAVPEKFQDFISLQQSHINKLIKTQEQLNVKFFCENG